jgi:hypothetical protein
MMRYWAMAVALAVSAPTQAAIYATTQTGTNLSSFGSGLVTGAPDDGGLWLSNTFDPPALPGILTVGFADPLGDGAGIDLKIYDVGVSGGETYNVYVSSDDIGYTLLGGYSSANNLIDFAGLFAGPVNFVRLTNTSLTSSADIDAFEGYFRYTGGAVPEPATWMMMIFGFAGLGAMMRLKSRRGMQFA